MAFTVRVSGKLEEIVREAAATAGKDAPADQAHRTTIVAFTQTALYMLAARFAAGAEAYSPNVDDPSTWGIEMVDDESLN